MAYKATKHFIAATKSRIDVLYELTKDGYDGTISSLNDSALVRVSAELIRRGVIKKEKKTGTKNAFTYLWVAKSEPTPCFYKDVATVLGQKKHDFDKAYRSHKNAAKAPKVVVVDAPIAEPIKSLADYTLAELWAEMQSRGVVIEDNHLVVVKKEVLA